MSCRKHSNDRPVQRQDEDPGFAVGVLVTIVIAFTVFMVGFVLKGAIEQADYCDQVHGALEVIGEKKCFLKGNSSSSEDDSFVEFSKADLIRYRLERGDWND